MIFIGTYNDLEILRETSIGLYLGIPDVEDVLLPKKYCPDTYEIGDTLRVFVYPDNQGRKVATTLEPKAQVHQFAFLQVKAIENVGAFLDWGLDKDLMVPFREQRQRMEKGRWYVVYVTIDERTGRIMATNKIEQRLDNHQLTVQQGEEVELLILQKTDLGYSSIINHRHKGLLYDNELFSGVNIGETMKGYIKNIRSDNKIDLSLQPQGYLNATDDHTSLIMEQLQAKNGFIPLNDKSPADQVYSTLGISKKAFKRAVGSLYKARKIMIEEGGIRLI